MKAITRCPVSVIALLFFYLKPMIDPATINLSELPSVLLSKKSALPFKSGFYFVIDSSEEVQYVGMTKNLKRRWINHHRYPDLESLEGVRIAYVIVEDVSSMKMTEDLLIRRFKPSLNGTRCIAYQQIEKQSKNDFPETAQNILQLQDISKHIESCKQEEAVEILEAAINVIVGEATGLGTEKVSEFLNIDKTRLLELIASSKP